MLRDSGATGGGRWNETKAVIHKLTKTGEVFLGRGWFVASNAGCATIHVLPHSRQCSFMVKGPEKNNAEIKKY